MVATYALGAYAERCEGSSPSLSTNDDINRDNNIIILTCE
jgi:hypothetical protein